MAEPRRHARRCEPRRGGRDSTAGGGGDVKRLRQLHPDRSPAKLIALLKRDYRLRIATGGTLVGAAAARPNRRADASAVDPMLRFMDASVEYTLSVAEIHSLDAEDFEKRRLLVTTVLAGNSMSRTILEQVIGPSAPHLGTRVVESIPDARISRVNTVLGEHFITKWDADRGAFALADRLPVVLGGVMGGGGNPEMCQLAARA